MTDEFSTDGRQPATVIWLEVYRQSKQAGFRAMMTVSQSLFKTDVHGNKNTKEKGFSQERTQEVYKSQRKVMRNGITSRGGTVAK